MNDAREHAQHSKMIGIHKKRTKHMWSFISQTENAQVSAFVHF